MSPQSPATTDFMSPQTVHLFITTYHEETPQDLYADKMAGCFLKILFALASAPDTEQFQSPSQIDGPFDGFRGWLQ